LWYTILLVDHWVCIVLWSILGFCGLSILQISWLHLIDIITICLVLWLLPVVPCYISHSSFSQVTLFLIRRWLVSICLSVFVRELLQLHVLIYLLLSWIFLLFWIGPVLVISLFFVSTLQMHFVLLLSISILFSLLVDLIVLQCGWSL